MQCMAQLLPAKNCTKYRILGAGDEGFGERSKFISSSKHNSFHRVNNIGNIFTHGAVTNENITDGVHSVE